MKTVLVFAKQGNPWVDRMWIRGLTRFAKSADWRLVAFSQIEPRREERRLRELLDYYRPDGLVVGYSEGLAGCLPKEIPTVWMDVAPRDVPRGDVLVTHAGRETAVVAAREFVKLGFLNFAVVGDAGDFPWSVERIRAFRREVGSRRCTVCKLQSPVEAGVACPRQLGPWLRRLPHPCGVFAVTDRIAENVLTAAAVEGLSVPDEIAVIGVDNDEDLCQMATPTLTSVATDWEKGGYLTGSALASEMSRPGEGPRRLSFGELGLVRRGSTTPGAVRVDSRVAEASVFIREHACEGIGVMDVVRRLGCSRRLAEMRYLQATGHSIFAEIRDAQFARVLVLLARRDVPVGVIADMCGWKSPVALRQYFERRTGLSLQDWRSREQIGFAKN